MKHRQEVAERVILVRLGVYAHRVAVPWLGEAGAKSIAVGGLCRRCNPAGGLTEMFAARSPNQPVAGIVGIIRRGVDAAIAKEDCIREVALVSRPGDVASRVVGVAQVLHHTLVGGKSARPGRDDAQQALGQRIEPMFSDGTVAMPDGCLLAAR